MAHGGGLMLIAVAMLSLVAGMFLLIKTCKEEMCCKVFSKIVAYAVVVISILLIIFGGYKTVWKFAHHEKAEKMAEMMGGRGMNPEMMKEMMKNCPMMKMMEEMKEGE